MITDPRSFQRGLFLKVIAHPIKPVLVKFFDRRKLGYTIIYKINPSLVDFSKSYRTQAVDLIKTPVKNL